MSMSADPLVSAQERPLTWTRLLPAFASCHNQPLNVFLHLLTTPACLLAVVGLLSPAGLWLPIALAAAHLAAIVRAVPIRIWLLTGLVLAGLIAVVTFWQPAWPVCMLLFIAAYGLQELAHWMTGEPTLQSTYQQQPDWLAQLAEHTVFLLPLVLASAWELRGTPLSFLVARNRVLKSSVSDNQRHNLEAIHNFVDSQAPPRDKTSHWWQSELTGEAADAFGALANAPAIREMFQAAHGAGHAVEAVAAMNEIYVAAPVDSLSSDKVFYTAHIDGPWAVFPFATLYRCMLAINRNDIVHTHFPLAGRDATDPLTHTLTTGQALAFDYNREPHYITSDDRPQPEQRISLKLHYVVYPGRLVTYGRTLGRLSTWYNTRARRLFLDTIAPDSLLARVQAGIILASTRAFEFVVTHIGWSNLFYVMLLALVSLAGGWPALFVAGTSFVHYLIYVATFADRENVAFARFKRNAIFFKTLALAQLAGLYLWHFSFNPLSLGLIVGGFGLAAWAGVVLGIDRSFFGEECGCCEPKRIKQLPYGLIPHPMILGAIIGLIGLQLSPGVRETFPWLVPAHIGCYLVVLLQEILSTPAVTDDALSTTEESVSTTATAG